MFFKQINQLYLKFIVIFDSIQQITVTAHISMSTYQAIIRQFRKQGLSEEQEITEHELKKALDSICSKNAGIAQFDHEVAHQIWNQTRDNQVGGPVKLKDFVNTMVKAQNILKQQVEYTQNLLRSQNDSRKKQQLLNDLFSYSQDHRSITMPFGLQQIRQSKQIQQSRMNNTIKPAKSFYFSTSVDEREQSTDLKIVFFLTLALLLLDLIVMFEKNNIYNLLGISFILCCYVLNYFEQIYVRFILIWTSVAILLDLVWLIVKTDSFWSPSQNNLHSNQQIGLLRFIIVMVCFQMIIKMVLLGLLFKYRAVGETLRKKIDIFGLITFLLDGSPDSHNLISNIFVDKNPPSSSFYQPV